MRGGRGSEDQVNDVMKRIVKVPPKPEAEPPALVGGGIGTALAD